MAGKNVFEMAYFVSSGTYNLNSVNLFWNNWVNELMGHWFTKVHLAIQTEVIAVCLSK